MKNIDYPVGINFIALVITCIGAGYFFGSSTLGSAVSGFVLSIFSSYVFFFLTVTLKERADKRKIKKIVNPMLSKIVSTFYVAIHNSVLFPNESCRPMPDASKLAYDELDALLDVDALNMPIKVFRSHYYQFDVKTETNIDELILNTTLPVASQLNEIKPYYYMLSHDVVKLLTDIEKSMYICFTGRRLEYEKSFVFDKKLFLEHFKLIKALDEHVEYNWMS